MFLMRDVADSLVIHDDSSYKHEEDNVDWDDEYYGGQKQSVERNALWSDKAHGVSEISVIREGEVTNRVLPRESKVANEGHW